MAEKAVKNGKKLGTDLTEGPIMKLLFVFVGPMILANLVQQLYIMVDLMVIGHYMGSTGTVGVSTGGEISDLVMPIAAAMGAAGQIYIGQLVGAKQLDKMKKAIGTLLTMLILCSIVLMIVAIAFRAPILRLLNCPEEAFIQADNYMVITSIGMPFIFGYNAICGVLRGLGESKKPLEFITIAAVTNIVLDILLVGPFHMESAGAAWATTISQAASCIASFIYMYRRKEHFDFELKLSYFKMDKEAAKIILALGVPQAARSLLVRFSMLYVNASVNSYGLTASATNSIGNKVLKFLEIFTSSFSQASSAMVAQNLGAKKPERAKKTVLYSFYTCMAAAIIIDIIILVFPKQLYSIFSSDSAVLEMGVTFLKIMTLHFIISAVTTTFQSMVIGCGNATLNFVIGVLDGVVCKIGLSIFFVVCFGMGVNGYWWGTALSRVLPAIICVWYYYSNRWQKRKLLTE